MRLLAESAGRRVQCPRCGHPFRVPGPGLSASDPELHAPPDSDDELDAPVEFKVVFKNDPEKLLKGTYLARTTAGGLASPQGSREALPPAAGHTRHLSRRQPLDR
jgi:hypothetical protein